MLLPDRVAGLELALLARDERMAASLGVIVPRRKVEIFVVGSLMATLGGVVYAGSIDETAVKNALAHQCITFSAGVGRDHLRTTRT
jgi:ABC-type branched-subunit amino acid transport system permease subunit